MNKREAYEKRGQEFWKRYYNQLVGARVIQFIGMNKDEDMDWNEAFPTFKVQLKDGTYAIIEVSQDDEGNGGGTLFGLAFPNMDEYDKKHGLNQYEEVKA